MTSAIGLGHLRICSHSFHIGKQLLVFHSVYNKNKNIYYSNQWGQTNCIHWLLSLEAIIHIQGIHKKNIWIYIYINTMFLVGFRALKKIKKNKNNINNNNN
jgi:hypothetical protein